MQLGIQIPGQILIPGPFNLGPSHDGPMLQVEPFVLNLYSYKPCINQGVAQVSQIFLLFLKPFNNGLNIVQCDLVFRINVFINPIWCTFGEPGLSSCIAQAGLARYPAGEVSTLNAILVFSGRLVAPDQGEVRETWLLYQQAKKPRVQALSSIPFQVGGWGSVCVGGGV